MPTRRKFLRDCSIAAAVSFGPAAVLAEPRLGRGTSANRISCELFAGELNTVFRALIGSSSVRLALVEAARLPAAAPDAEDARNERFSLLFRGSVEEGLPQDTHLLDHPRIGRLAMFLVPIGSLDASHRYYEAIFNFPRDDAGLEVQVGRGPKRGGRSRAAF